MLAQPRSSELAEAAVGGADFAGARSEARTLLESPLGTFGMSLLSILLKSGFRAGCPWASAGMHAERRHQARSQRATAARR